MFESLKGFYTANKSFIIIVLVIIILTALFFIGLSMYNKYREKKNFGGLTKNEFVNKVSRIAVSDKEKSIKQLDKNYAEKIAKNESVKGIFDWYYQNAVSNGGSELNNELIKKIIIGLNNNVDVNNNDVVNTFDSIRQSYIEGLKNLSV